MKLNSLYHISFPFPTYLHFISFAHVSQFMYRNRKETFGALLVGYFRENK
jgi:hypothetical protein